MSDPNTNFLTSALLRHFEESERLRSSRDSSQVENETEEEENDNER